VREVQTTTLDNGVPSSQDLPSPVAGKARGPGFYTELSSPDQTPPPPSAGDAAVDGAEQLNCLGVGTPARKTLHLVRNSPLKQQLVRLLDILGLDKQSVDDFPKQGYTRYTEAQTGKGRLDTHFSFVNTVFRTYVESGKDTRTEREMTK
jgi:hypothetical protein